MEIWKKVIQNYEYEVSDKGQVRNSKTGRVLKPNKNKFGYYQVCLYKDKKKKWFRVHRLVYEAFNGKIPDGMVIDHRDAVKTNNCLENLRVCTQKENVNNPVTRPRHIDAMRKLHANPEFKKKNTEALRKLVQSPEWKKKTADAVRKARGKSVVQIDKKTDQTIRRWECARDASRELGINNASISDCCTGKQKSAGGFKWQFAS